MDIKQKAKCFCILGVQANINCWIPTYSYSYSVLNLLKWTHESSNVLQEMLNLRYVKWNYQKIIIWLILHFFLPPFWKIVTYRLARIFIFYGKWMGLNFIIEIVQKAIRKKGRRIITALWFNIPVNHYYCTIYISISYYDIQ